ncbi:aminopeptidase [Mycoemilia scoparia]|uniref:Aminopeptidase n=1 Tax=Mycoemilia scoparia TaxID=417184 RepID=A0A9W7ZTB2_9FUNG|nr:aminopeptidase [Mycoemilia scoparia]
MISTKHSNRLLTHPELITSDEVIPGITKAEFEIRRKKLMDSVPGSNDIVVLFSAPTYYMSPHVFYPFRQNSNFLYTTGFNEPSSAVVFEKSNTAGRGYVMTLFVRPKEPEFEVWDGPRSGIEKAVETFGADQAFAISEFEGYMRKLLKRIKNSSSGSGDGDTSGQVYADIPEKSERLVKSESSTLLDICKEYNMGPQLRSASPLVQKLRLIKSEAEINLMREANKISARGFIGAMQKCRPGLNEQQLADTFESEFRKAAPSPNSNTGSGTALTRWAYVPVVASGTHALVMHYVQNNRQIKPEELVLMDAGAEYCSYASDITRTIPSNGKWTEAQKDLYSAVLSVQTECLKHCHASSGNSLNSLHKISSSLLQGALSRLGIEFSHRDFEMQLYPHHLAHYIGLDVHDTPDMTRSQQLQPGMVVTIEPGVYIPIDDKYPKHFQGIGIRIEDNVVIGENRDDSENLSLDTPKSVEAIQEVMSFPLD